MQLNIRHLSFAAAFAVAAVASTVVIAADHDEVDTASFSDDAADLGDLYAFHDDARLTVILTFDGYKLRGDEPNYDGDVLYGVHMDTDGDNAADHDIWARFGQNSAGEWGLQVAGIPGQDAPLVGPVEELIRDEDTGAEAFAGLRDDPFFFDLEGFGDTLMTGDLQFNPERDFVTLKNTVALALEFDHATLGGDSISVWATTGRL